MEGKIIIRAKTTKPLSAPPEWRLQAAQVLALRRARQAGWPIRIEGDMNAGRRTLRESGIAAAAGINPGAADLRVFLPNGRLVMFENKTGKGSLSKEQKEAHAEFTALGHEVIVIKTDDAETAAALAVAAVSERLGLPVPHWTPPANDNVEDKLKPKRKRNG